MAEAMVPSSEPWFHGACTTSGPLRMEGGCARGLDAGHSLSFYERMWLHGWFAGAAMVTPENSIAVFFETAHAPWKLTAHGEKAVKLFAFMRSRDRGIPFTPIAIVLDHLAGYNPIRGDPGAFWTRHHRATRRTCDLLEEQLFPAPTTSTGRPIRKILRHATFAPRRLARVSTCSFSSTTGETLRGYL